MPTIPRATVPLALALLLAGEARAQAADSAHVAVTVRHDTSLVEGATVRAGRAGGVTDARGVVVLRLPAGLHRVVASRPGLAPDSLTLVLRAGQDTSVVLVLAEAGEELEAVVVVAATRSNRRIEDEPLRVETLEREEVEEKMLMTPGDVAMLLNETSGLRVQTTSPALGGAGVRVQGLPARYTQVLADGLPLHGGQTGALGLLQIPPMDLGRVEVIKGSAAALHGARALGGVINLVARRPAADERELLVNRTSRGGTDGVLWLADTLGGGLGWSLLAGAHGQERRDLDADGWADLAGYRRVVLRPRVAWDDGAGRSLFATVGATAERRAGGTLPGRAAPDGAPYAERLDTRRLDAGLVGRALLGGWLLGARGSVAAQRHAHRFGGRPEDDAHGTAFAEATLARAVAGGRATLLGGLAFSRETYRSEQLPRFDYGWNAPAAFAQLDADPAAWLALSAGLRADLHEEYGTLGSPRVSALVRLPGAWTLRASLGAGSYAPTPFTEETEATGLAPVLVPEPLRPERATTASLDLGGSALGAELGATLFGSVVRRPLAVGPNGDDGTGGPSAQLVLFNAPVPTRTRGAELLARRRAEPFVVTGTYTFIRSTSYDPETGRRGDAPLLPRHAAGLVGMYEPEGVGRVGVELYYTGRQALRDTPYRDESRPYVILGALAERVVGRARVFVNFENLLDVRQTRWDPLVLPARGAGGRWTTDVWTELAGRTVNGGARIAF